MSKEFLDELLEHAKCYGHDGDYVAVRDFVRYVWSEAGIELTDEQLEPYPCQWTEEELRELGWTYAGHSMMLCEKYPGAWDAWVDHAVRNIGPRETTDTKMAVAFTAFVRDYLKRGNLTEYSLEQLQQMRRAGSLRESTLVRG